jgi:archaeal flagellin FlaB
LHLIQKGHRHAHRGIIGIESAIVLIAFVIVAAALAFVVLNMGFSTTQKAKTSIIAALLEAGSSLEVAGKITGVGDISDNVLNATTIPLKIVSGGASSNVDGNYTSIKVITSSVEYDNVYEFGPIFVGTYANASQAWNEAENRGWICNGCNPYNGTANPLNTIGITYWNVNQNNNTIVDAGEHLQLSVAFAENDRPGSLDFFAVEISPPTGAPMTVERTIPNINNVIVDLG